MSDFPPDFLWGAATAAHQVEGGNVNNQWWDWEHAPGTTVRQPSGDAIDHWNRYEDDFALLASLGHNAHRFSVEWSRIEPAPGEFSQAALDHYQRMLASMHRHGLSPFTTLHHFTVPRWFEARGGWLAPDAVELFGRYVEKVANALGDQTNYFGTVNEPQVLAVNGYLTGAFPPGLHDFGTTKKVNRTLAAAHLAAVSAVRAGRGTPQVGTCLAINHTEPLRAGHPHDVAATAVVMDFGIETHLDSLRSADDPGDFVGLQYYTRDRIDGTSPAMTALLATASGAVDLPPVAEEATPAPDVPPQVERTQTGWEVYPQGFGSVLRLLGRVGLPVIVTENGIATADDTRRVQFLADHLLEVKSALDDGVDVRGYFHWSAFDNYEWGTYDPLFGLVGIDRTDDLRRVPRPSAELYARVARSGSLEPLRAAATGR